MGFIFFINILSLTFGYNDSLRDLPSSNSNYAESINADSVPVWVRHLYETANQNFLNGAVPSVRFFKTLSDSTSYCIYVVDDGVCHMSFVATQKNKKKYKNSKIGSECDEDFSVPDYSFTTYTHNAVEHTIVITTTVDQAKSKYLVKDENGMMRFKDGYDMENVETINHTTKQTIVVTTSGNLVIKTKTGH
jgi:hypothetical protein